jgi:UDP-N-acetylmuramoyl-tripeptide--D-alanyl-D-alanine ligase
MKDYSIEKLAQIINAKPPAHIDGTITGSSTDSRTTKQGDCFFAIKGSNFDGHDYLDEAFSKGAACAVVNKEVNYQDKAILQVADTVRALGEFAKEYRESENFKVIAVTGSAGKTTTREMIYHVLKDHFKCHRAPKSFNTDVGVPLTLLGAEPECQIIIAELGSNHPGEIAQLSEIAQPDIALITNVQQAHLAGFGNLQTIIEEKVSITQGLRAGGTLIINGWIPELIESCRKSKLKFSTFGTEADCDYRAENFTVTAFAGSFNIDGIEVTVPLPGDGNLQNALAAWAVCHKLGVSIQDFAEAMQTIQPVSGRVQIIKAGPLFILNDCYNANPGSMKNALECLAKISSARQSRPVFVCGDMLELGDQSEQLHSRLGQAVAAAGVKLLFAAGKFAKTTADAAKETANGDFETACFEDTTCLCNELEKFVRPGDIILVKGSRGCKLEAAVEKLKRLFS